MLTCGPRAIDTSIPNENGEDGESCSDDDEISEDEETKTVRAISRHDLIFLITLFHHYNLIILQSTRAISSVQTFK